MVAVPIIDGLVTLGTTLIERIFPDKEKADAAKLELLKLQASGELAQLQAETSLALKQGDINVEEAKNPNLFVSGWRPGLGWIMVLAFGAKYVGGPLLYILSQYTSHTIALPPIDMTEMLPILMGMLGLAGMRTFEKVKGVV